MISLGFSSASRVNPEADPGGGLSFLIHGMVLSHWEGGQHPSPQLSFDVRRSPNRLGSRPTPSDTSEGLPNALKPYSKLIPTHILYDMTSKEARPDARRESK
jgi:hypothetical protein